MFTLFGLNFILVGEIMLPEELNRRSDRELVAQMQRILCLAKAANKNNFNCSFKWIFFKIQPRNSSVGKELILKFPPWKPKD